jgi:imidazolonepropionase-like amidohydrolase
MPEYPYSMGIGSTFVKDVAVLWGPELEPVESTGVALRGGRVHGPGATPSPGDEIVDGAGLLLVPGFVDAHVHIGFADPAEVLRRGVTTVRDLGWPPDTIFGLARASRSSRFDGPLILAAGPILTAPDGYPARAAWAPRGTARELDGPEAAVAAVRDLVGAGAWSIKFALNPPVGPVLDRDTLAAVVAAAHETSGMKVTGHVHGRVELEKAIACGVDELAHMLMGEEELDDATVTALVAAGITIVPTLSIRFGRDRELAVANLARFRSAGGNVVYGTDLGNEGPAPGIDRTEVRALAEAGLGARAIVRAATVDAARHLGLESKGILDEGRDADVVAVPVDALDEPERLCDVRMVWREGRRAA